MKFVQSVVSFLRNSSFSRTQLCCGGRELFPYWHQGGRKGTRSKNLAVSNIAMLFICLALIAGCNRAPTANPGGPYSGVAGTAVTFDGSGSSDPDHDSLSFTWALGDGTTANGATPTHTYSTGGIFTITLTVNDGHTDNKASTTATIQSPPGTPVTKTTFAKSDNKSWASTGGANVSSATDSNTSTTSWKFTRLGGIGSSVGMIESIEFPGKCLRSPNLSSNSQIELAACDSTDTSQRWFGFKAQVPGNQAFYVFQTTYPNASQKCLTEGSNSQVIQTDYNQFDTQHWSVLNKNTFAFDTGADPWF
jgi:PKD repeat protein